MYLSDHNYAHTGAQDVVVSIVNPESQEILCPDQPVVFHKAVRPGQAFGPWPDHFRGP